MSNPSLRLLSLDTSTAAGSIVLSEGDKLLGEINLEVAATHSARLLPGIEHVLKFAGISLSELHALAVINGPGSFTGLRIGLATVKGLAAASGKPVIPINAFDAWAEKVHAGKGMLTVMIDARRQEVYSATFQQVDQSWIPLLSGRVDKVENLVPLFPTSPMQFVGDGALRYRPLLETPDHPEWRVVDCDCFLGRPLAKLALQKALSGATLPAREVQAYYLRKSDAELFWKEK